MLRRGMLLVESPLLRDEGFRHGFSLRTGGVSKPPFDSLNLGRGLGDRPEDVEENHRRFAEAVGFRTLYEVSQVHGSQIRVVAGDEDAAMFRQSEGDAVIATRPGVAVGIRVADCVPVLLANRRTGSVAAVHAGWRGVVAKIVPQAVHQLVGDVDDDLLVAIGPHIGADRFEVGPDVASQLEQAMAPGDSRCPVNRTGLKPYVDLSLILISQLTQCGLKGPQIDRIAGCTYSEPDRFFSYRRDGRDSGRHLAAIVAS